MAKYGPSSTYILVGGCDLTGDTYQLDIEAESALEDSRGFASDTWEESTPTGIGKVVVTPGDGLYDDRAAGLLQAYQGAGATVQVADFGNDGLTVGAKALLTNGLYAAVWKRKLSKDGLTLGNAQHTVSGSLLNGRIVSPLTLRSGATGNTEATPLDLGAPGTAGTFQLHVPVLTLGGGTNVIVKVRHSTDGITFADLVTFTAVTLAGTAERKTFTGTVNRYLAMSWSFTGGGAGSSAQLYVSEFVS